MTPPRTPSVQHGTLTLGRQLGHGGQGAVYEVPNKKINAADGGGWDVVYKEYSAAVLPDLDAAALASHVGLLGELSADEGRWLCDKTAWPAAVVERGGHACGFLMRAVPDRFRFTLWSLTERTAGTQRLANLEYLLNDDSYVAGIGLAISERDRLLILADLAATLARLHRIGITVGDLSPKNLLFTIDPKPECFLIDGGAMRLRGTSVLPQAETPDWQIPTGEEKATRASDVYKLALLAVRLVARDQIATDPAALAVLSPALGDLARTSLNPDPTRRPTPSAWAEQLTTTAADAVGTSGLAPAHRVRASGAPAKSAPSATRMGSTNAVPAASWGLILVVLAVALASVRAHVSAADVSDFFVALLPWTLFALGLWVLAVHVRAALARRHARERVPVWRWCVRSLAPPAPWTGEERDRRRAAAERALDEALLMVDLRVAAESPSKGGGRGATDV
ncbi:hypothetical protein [Streptomyces sp. NPDC093097]|uniref:hypothetical protein n=1 Tax=Streptomyces sp. NPDC093097 TaxID=3366027 RepID=UPI0037F63577